jgi:hypothetical protein
MPSMEEIIKDCEHRPGWSFDYEPGIYPLLLIHARVQNSRGPGDIEFTVKRVIPNYVRRLGSAAAIVQWVKEMVIEAEIHEVREFFKYKGKVFDDPHELKVIPPTSQGYGHQGLPAPLRSDGEWPR